MTYQSVIASLGANNLKWPGVRAGYGMAEKHYMVPFTKHVGLPTHMGTWQPFVDVMLKDIDVPDDTTMYVMVDQDYVKEGSFHRRPGLHIDGYWHANEMGAQFDDAVGMHRERPPYPYHYPVPRPRHAPVPTHLSGGADWNNPDFSVPEAIVLMSNIEAAQGYRGEWDGVIGDKGDCSQIMVTDMEPITFEANRVVIGNVSMLHESLPVPVTGERTVIRLNIPGVEVR